MGLISSDTLWIFLLASSGEPEIRHIYDIIFGVCNLELKGIKPENIRLVIDGDKETISANIKTYIENEYNIYPSSYLETIIKNSSYNNIVVFVTGHGYFEQGIDAPNPIRPYDLLNNLRCNEVTENIVIYLGQCYAGIFNYVNVSNAPKTIIIGATNLYPSISCEISKSSWMANLFLFNLFKWISSPIDIDGDGKFTVMDSYKYAGAETNRYCHQYKGDCLKRILQILDEQKSLHNENETIEKQLKLKALNDELFLKQTIHYNHQEPWILNAVPAQTLEF